MAGTYQVEAAFSVIQPASLVWVLLQTAPAAHPLGNQFYFLNIKVQHCLIF